jgi:hypothetical protein
MDRAKIRELEERVSQFQLLRLPEQPEVMHTGTSNLVADLLKTVRDLARELEAKERIVENVVDALAPVLEAKKAVTFFVGGRTEKPRPRRPGLSGRCRGSLPLNARGH